MTEKDVHKCLISNGFYPMVLVLKELEKQDRFEECKFILDAMNSYKERFNVEYDTFHSDKLEKEYFSYYKESHFLELAKNNVNYYMSDIRNRLNLK